MHNGIELREETPGKLVLRGHPSVSEVWYPVGSFEEKVNRGTWKRSLGEGPDCVLLENHAGIALARTKAGNLALSETARGLFCEAELDATTPRVQHLRSAVENCGLQMSVGFFCKDDEWSEDGSKRELKSASLHKGDVTLCNFGANPATDSTISERGGDNLSVAERRSFAEAMSGARECRMAPIAYDLGASRMSNERERVIGPRSRGRSQIAVPRKPSVTRRSHIELAKAYAVKGSRALPGSDASVEGQEETPRYTQAQITKLGEAGKAYKRRNGTYSFPIVGRRDLLNAIKAWGRAAPSEAAAVKTFIKRRAVLLKLDDLLPPSWGPAPKTAAPAVGTEVGA